MTLRGLAATLALALLVAMPASAAGPSQAAAPVKPDAVSVEVRQLVGALGRSGCRFQRNGAWHDAAAAQAHLQRKYDWMRERDKVASTEQFIRDGASRSSMTGRAYQVRCPGQPDVTSGQWLLARLKALRQAPASADAR